MHRLRPIYVSLALVLLSASPALAADDVAKVQNFIQNIITILVTLAGLIAAGFFVGGGITYITSSGNPERLDRAKQTIIFSSLGLAITLGAYVLSNIITQIATTAFK